MMNNEISIIDITIDNYYEEVVSSSVPVLLDFWAEWCKPCTYVSQMTKEIANETDAKVCKINVDKEIGLVLKHDVTTVPTLLIFKDGKVTHKIERAQAKNSIKKMLVH